MGVPPSSHFIYIPVVLVLGTVVGFILGSRAARDAIVQEQKRAADRAARKAARATGAATGAAEEKSPPG